jgi:CheY-like chemotaxis protein
MLSRIHIAPGDENHRVLATSTLSDIPLPNRQDAASERPPLWEAIETKNAHSKDSLTLAKQTPMVESGIFKTDPNRLNFSFALVIEEAADFRNLVMTLLRGRGWLVHGTSRAEDAFSILAHIPYGLIVVDSELPGICGIDFIRILKNSREWRTIRLVVITSCNSPNFTSRVTEFGAFLARRPRWEDDLLELLTAEREHFQTRHVSS